MQDCHPPRYARGFGCLWLPRNDRCNVIDKNENYYEIFVFDLCGKGNGATD
jgi:hypothetical protein